MSEFPIDDLLPKPKSITRKVLDGGDPKLLSRSVEKPSKFMRASWKSLEPDLKRRNSNNLNGRVFESQVAVLTYRSGIRPLFLQAQLAFVPNVFFDLVLFSKEFGPIVLSQKTSLRERYKQADLEGMMLRQVHRKARTFLITNDKKEADRYNKKIERDEILGIERFIYAFDNELDKLFFELKQMTFFIPEKVEVITGKIIE